MLWAVVVRQASTWLEAMGTIALAVAGRAVGYAVLFYTGQDEEESWGMGVYGPSFLGQMVLWGLLWVCIRLGRGRLPQDSTGAQA